jgi:hypothetical protein
MLSELETLCKDFLRQNHCPAPANLDVHVVRNAGVLPSQVLGKGNMLACFQFTA